MTSVIDISNPGSSRSALRTALLGVNSSLQGKRWAALGTSITADGSYTSRLATISGMVLTNLGISGASISNSSIYGGGSIYSAIASIPSNTEIVTIEAGINDFRGNATLGSLGDTTISTFYGALYKAAIDVKASNGTRILAFLTPYGNADTYATGRWNNNNDNGVSLRQFVQAIKDVGSWMGVPVIDVGGESGIGGPTANTFMTDLIHLNTTGGQRYAEYVMPRLESLAFTATVAEPSQVSTPSFSPSTGTYSGSQNVSIYSATSGANIYYTTNGSDPTTSSSLYSSPLTVSSTTTIKALAVKSGLTNSSIGTAVITINASQVSTPQLSPSPGSFTSAQTVTITTSTSGANIYYTTDGSTPNTSSTLYSGAIDVGTTTTVKAIATKSGLADSSVASGTYTISSDSWNLRTATVDDMSGYLVSGISIDGSNTVIATAESGTYQALWLVNGSDNALEWELADAKGQWLLWGAGSDGTWAGAGDTSQGVINFLGTFSSVGSVSLGGSPNPASSSIPSPAVGQRWRAKRVGDVFTAYVYNTSTSAWDQVLSIDVTAQSVASSFRNVAKIGLLMSTSSYARVKNVRVGTAS